MRALVAYGRKVYDLRERLEAVTDSRQQAIVPSSDVAAAVFFCGLLRIRSFNALEPRLRERPYRRLIGSEAEPRRLVCADTLSRVLRRMDVATLRSLVVGMVKQAERNKVFREGWYRALRYVAVDGWEPITSRGRHCRHCLVRRVKVKDRTGAIVEVEEYYHRYVVAMLIDARFDLMLDLEPLLPSDRRPSGSPQDEGELTAARRLVLRIAETYPWVDVVVADGLYANGPFLTTVKEAGLGAVVIAKKATDEPLREALTLWSGQPATETIEDRARGEQLALWDCRGVETLMTYRGPIRVVRGEVTRRDEPTAGRRTWCMAVTGTAMRLSSADVLSVARARWHIENTGFHQWTTRWRFAHVFVHDGPGIEALYWLFFAAYNLLTLFLYRQVRRYGRDRGGDGTRTISRLIDEMLDELARLTESPWDTS